MRGGLIRCLNAWCHFLQEFLQEFIMWRVTKCNMFFIILCSDDALKLAGIAWQVMPTFKGQLQSKLLNG